MDQEKYSVICAVDGWWKNLINKHRYILSFTTIWQKETPTANKEMKF